MSNFQLDVYGLYLYDALSMYAVLIDQMMAHKENYRNGIAMVKRAKAFHAEGRLLN